MCKRWVPPTGRWQGRSSRTRAHWCPAAWSLLWAAVLTLGAACGGQHVMLQVPGSGPGERFECDAEGKCVPAAVDPPAPANMPEAAVIALPSACEGRFHQVVIYNADSSKPEVGVTCASAPGASTTSATDVGVVP